MLSPLAYLLEYNRIYNLLGIAVIIGIAVLFSHHRSRINWRLVITGLILHFVLALAVLKTTIGENIVSSLANMFTKLYEAADIGISFVFGNLANPSGPWSFVFAIKVLPVIIFFGAFYGTPLLSTCYTNIGYGNK